jgi:ribosomal protein L37E
MSQAMDQETQVSPAVKCERCGFEQEQNQNAQCSFCGFAQLSGATRSSRLQYVELRGIGRSTVRAAVLGVALVVVFASLVAVQNLRVQAEARAAATATATAVALQARAVRAREFVDAAERNAASGQFETALSEIDEALKLQPSLERAGALRADVTARATTTAGVEATRVALAAEATRTAQAVQATRIATAAAATRTSDARRIVATAEALRDTGDTAGALAAANQALGLQADLPSAIAVRDDVAPAVTATAGAISASATAQAVAASATATAQAVVSAREKKWNEFLVYAPKLVSLLQQSDEINRNHAALAARLTVANAPQFYTQTDRAAAATGNLKKAALGVSTPSEARDLQNSVRQALSIRENAFNKLKDALDAPGRLSAQAEYQEAKRAADVSALDVVVKLLQMCDSMNVGPDECNSAVGLSS